MYGYGDYRISAYLGLTGDVSSSKSTKMQSAGLVGGFDYGFSSGLVDGAELEIRHSNINMPNQYGSKFSDQLKNQTMIIPRATMATNPDGEGFSTYGSFGAKFQGADFNYAGLEAKGSIDYKGLLKSGNKSNSYYYLGANSKYENFDYDNNISILKAGLHAGVQKGKSKLGIEAGYQLSDQIQQKPELYVGATASICIDY